MGRSRVAPANQGSAGAPSRSQTLQEPEHRRVGRLRERGEGVRPAYAGDPRRLPGQGGSDAAAVVVVGDLQSEVDNARLPADGPDADQGQWPLVSVEPDPALRLGEQPRQVAGREAGTAPSTHQVVRGTLRVEGGDQVPVRRRHRAQTGEGRMGQQEQLGRAASTSLRR